MPDGNVEILDPEAAIDPPAADLPLELPVESDSSEEEDAGGETPEEEEVEVEEEEEENEEDEVSVPLATFLPPNVSSQARMVAGSTALEARKKAELAERLK